MKESSMGFLGMLPDAASWCIETESMVARCPVTNVRYAGLFFRFQEVWCSGCSMVFARVGSLFSPRRPKGVSVLCDGVVF